MNQRFETQEVALEMAAQLRPALEALRRHDGDLAGQARRAAASVVLNIAEGAGRRGRDRLQHYRIAAGSAGETAVALRLAVVWGYLDPADVVAVEALLDRVQAMLWLGLSPSGLRPGRAAHAALFACGKWWRLTRGA